MSSNKPGISEDLASSLMQLNSTEAAKSGKVSKVFAELMTVFVKEAATRAAMQAHNEKAALVEVEHVEKVLPQLLLDF